MYYVFCLKTALRLKINFEHKEKCTKQKICNFELFFKELSVLSLNNISQLYFKPTPSVAHQS